MKKLALLLAMVMLLVCVLASCNGTTEESKDGTTSTAASEAGDDNSVANVESEDEEGSTPDEESEEPAGPTYAEGTVEIDRSLEAKSVTQGLVPVNEITSSRDDAWGSLTNEDEDGNVTYKFTDGVKGESGGQTADFFGTSAGFEVILDLGEKVDGLADFSVWSAICESWGISVIDSVQFFVSDDGETWLPIADAVPSSEVEEVAGSGEWKLYEFKTELEMGVSAQYVKFVINKAGHVWIGEVNVDIYE